MQLKNKPAHSLLYGSLIATCVVMTACGGGGDATENATQASAATGELRTAQSTVKISQDESAGDYPISALTVTEPNGVCQDFYAADAKLAVGEIIKPWGTTAKPVRGIAVKESNWGTCQVRVTDHDADGVGFFARNDYSRRQAFNADSTRQLIYALDGKWHIYDTVTNQRVGALPNLAADAEPHWHHKLPNVLFYLPTNGVGMKFYRLNVKTGTADELGDFSERLKQKWPKAYAASTKSEGSPSADGRYWCFMVQDAQFKTLGIFTWDKSEDIILGMADIKTGPDHVSMSPTGNYCVVSNYNASGVVAYDRNLLSSKRITALGIGGQANEFGQHSDIGLDANGEDMFISWEQNNGYVYTANLRTGNRNYLFPTYGGATDSFHFSGKAYNKPGYFLMSAYAEQIFDGGQRWTNRKVMAVKLGTAPGAYTVYNLADNRYSSPPPNNDFTKPELDPYWAEPQATVNRDFTRVVWNSNWDAKDTKVDTYSVQLKPSMLP